MAVYNGVALLPRKIQHLLELDRVIYPGIRAFHRAAVGADQPPRTRQRIQIAAHRHSGNAVAFRQALYGDAVFRFQGGQDIPAALFH